MPHKNAYSGQPTFVHSRASIVVYTSQLPSGEGNIAKKRQSWIIRMCELYAFCRDTEYSMVTDLN